MSRSRDTIVEVQYLRALAVLLVVAGHAYQNEGRFFAEQAFGPFMYFGFSGVDVFFVISGFIIHTLYRGAENLDPGFYLMRLNRIFPMYWLFTLGAVLGYTLVLGRPLEPVLTETDWIRTLTLWPTGEHPILPVAWTLTHELYFYLIYALYLAAPKRWRPLVAGGWLVLTLAGIAWPGAQDNPLLRILLSPFNLLFLAGAVLAEFRGRLVPLKWPALAAALAGAALGLYWTGLHGVEGLNNAVVRVAVFAPFAVGISWAVLSWKPVLPGFAVSIGNWSYVLYLGHSLVLDVLARMLAPRLDGSVFDSLVFYSLGSVSVLVMAAIAHRFFERPALAIGKSAIGRLTASRTP